MSAYRQTNRYSFVVKTRIRFIKNDEFLMFLFLKKLKHEFNITSYINHTVKKNQESYVHINTIP